jgi:SNF2 family DNA or RNA helicase
MKVEIDLRTIFLYTSFDNRFKCKAIPAGRWNPARAAWAYPATPATCTYIIAQFPELAENGALRDIIDTATRRDAKTTEIKGAEALPQPDGVRSSLWLHQKKFVKLASVQESFMFSADMGCGKSLASIAIIASNKDIKKTLIVCPKSVQPAWAKQVALHCTADIGVAILEGSVKDKKSQAERLINLYTATGKQLMLIMNYESTFREPMASFLLSAKFDLVVADESTKIKSAGGRTSRFFQKLGKTAKKRIATPLTGTLLSIYGQFRFLCPEIFGTSFSMFKNEYAISGGYGGHEIIGFKNIEKFNKLFYSKAYRVTAEEVLDLPETLDINRTFELSPGCRSVYKHLKKELIAEIDNGTITAANGLVKLLRLSQITGGHCTNDDGETVEVDTGKQELLAEILEEIEPDEPMCIFARFTADIAACIKTIKAAGRSVGELSGHANDLKAFQDGTIHTLVVQIASGGMGIELQHCGDRNVKYCCFYSVSYSLTEFLQAKARVHRPGQKENVNYIYLIAENTIDEIIYKALEAKKDHVEFVLGELKKEA